MKMMKWYGPEGQRKSCDRVCAMLKDNEAVETDKIRKHLLRVLREADEEWMISM
jgi:hypothetical protein